MVIYSPYQKLALLVVVYIDSILDGSLCLYLSLAFLNKLLPPVL